MLKYNFHGKKLTAFTKRPHQRTIKTQVGPSEPSYSPIRRVGPNESPNSPVGKVGQLDQPLRAPPLRYLSNSDRNAFRFISIGVSVEILRQKQVGRLAS